MCLQVQPCCNQWRRCEKRNNTCTHLHFSRAHFLCVTLLLEKRFQGPHNRPREGIKEGMANIGTGGWPFCYKTRGNRRPSESEFRIISKLNIVQLHDYFTLLLNILYILHFLSWLGYFGHCV